MSSEEYKAQLDKIVAEVIGFFDNAWDYDRIVYTDWTAKDVLGHLVMWHESFARNVDSLVQERKATPLKGSLTEVNETGVRESRKYSLRELQDKMRQAHEIIMRHILDEKIHLIPYKKGSRDYTRDEHMEVVYRHIRGHLADLRRTYSS